MSFRRKDFTLCLILVLVTLCVLLVKPCVATVTVPANPEPGPEIVSVEIDNRPIWNPPSYSTNSYTGEVTKLKPGYYSPNGSITITIKNSPFIPYTDTNGNAINVYYSLFYKNAPSYDLFWDYPCRAVYQSGSVYTVIIFTYGSVSMADMRTNVYVTSESKVVDFRIQAVTGYFNQEIVYDGEGSAFTEFSVKMPHTDEPGISKPNIKPTSVAPPTSNPNNPPSQNTQQQKPLQSKT